jgi:aryl-alcohol dehydrogenase-like predicted oxidoreductase
MPYGIGNTEGQPDLDSSEQIVATAWEGGIREFDTAQAYGESEKIMGAVIKGLGIESDARVISKISPNLDHLSSSHMSRAMDRSLADLGVSSLYGMMVHGDEALDMWNHGLGDILKGFVAKGKAVHIGASVYSPEKAIEALDAEGITMVQVPGNVLDQRFHEAEVFERAEHFGKTIYVRSIFLQGLLLMKSEAVPSKMRFAQDRLRAFESLAHNCGISKEHLAMAYIRERCPHAKVLFGAETPEQVRANLRVWDEPLPIGVVEAANELSQGVEERVVNPSLWPK